MEGLFQYLREIQSSDGSGKVKGIWTQHETPSRLFRSVPGDFYYANIWIGINKKDLSELFKTEKLFEM